MGNEIKKSNAMLNWIKNNLGLIFAIISCILFWWSYEYTEVQRTWYTFWIGKKETIKHLDLKPSLITGLIALITLCFLNIRGLIDSSGKNAVNKFISFVINLTLLTTLMEIIFSPGSEIPTKDIFKDNAVLLSICVFCGAVIFFGVREIAKMVVMIFIFGAMLINLKLVSAAMGILGFIALICVCASFWFQQNISFEKLYIDLQYLFIKSGSYIERTADSVELELQDTADKIKVAKKNRKAKKEKKQAEIED